MPLWPDGDELLPLYQSPKRVWSVDDYVDLRGEHGTFDVPSCPACDSHEQWYDKTPSPGHRCPNPYCRVLRYKEPRRREPEDNQPKRSGAEKAGQ